MAPTVADAVYDTVGVRVKELRLTPEKVCKSMTAKQDFAITQAISICQQKAMGVQ